MIADLCTWAERDFPISAEANGGRLMLTLEEMPLNGAGYAPRRCGGRTSHRKIESVSWRSVVSWEMQAS